jgi:hypothetical protein
MKVGIITTHYALNYGAVLQAYALQNYLNSTGYESEIIDYRPNKPVYGRSWVNSPFTIRNMVKNMISFVNVNYRKNHREKVQLFDHFLADHLPLSSRKYYDEKDFRQVDMYDAFICGSDQIWNLNLMDDSVYYLPFNKQHPNAKYIAYAPSIAENLSLEQLKVIGNRTLHFNALSLRETISAHKLSCVISREVTPVLDPIFLLNAEEWMSITTNNKLKNRYILCYFLGYSDVAIEAVKKIKDLLGYEVVNVGLDPRSVICANVDKGNVSPIEFVWLIQNADFICTNSFHATAFSILFNKAFFSVTHSTRNSRMENLFKLFEIHDRQLTTLDDLIKIPNNLEYNYNNANIKIKEQIFLSKKYITRALRK